GKIEKIEKDFNTTCNLYMETIVHLYRRWFRDEVKIIPGETASSNLKRILNLIRKRRLAPLYVIIDEYDNFANQLIAAQEDGLYHDLTNDDSFLKTFFKTLKEGRKTGAINNVFITGVLPITIDDLASGFNIGTFITMHPTFEQMLGFTQDEVDRLLDDVYKDYGIDPETRLEVDDLIKNHYNGYMFIRTDGEALYNSTILMYFLQQLC
ncbi:MAG: AAA family ATPase, partial [Proteobacteria bacterium]|nr:AAA family ATPase [Pseudomonadota bacterium]